MTNLGPRIASRLKRAGPDLNSLEGKAAMEAMVSFVRNDVLFGDATCNCGHTSPRPLWNCPTCTDPLLVEHAHLKALIRKGPGRLA